MTDADIEAALAKATPPPYIELVMGAFGPRIWWEGCAPEAWADAERHRYTLVDDPQLMLIGVLADIRMVTGLREKPMLDELPAEIGRLIAAKDTEIERLRAALADAIDDIKSLYEQRWCEMEGDPEDAVKDYVSVLEGSSR